MVKWIYYGEYATGLEEWSDNYEDQVPYRDPEFEALSAEHNFKGEYQNLGAHLEVSRIADYYNIIGLQQDARKSIESILSSPCETALFASLLARLDRLVTEKLVYDMFVKYTGKFLREIVATPEFQLVNFSCDFLKDVMNEYLKIDTNKK